MFGLIATTAYSSFKVGLGLHMFYNLKKINKASIFLCDLFGQLGIPLRIWRSSRSNNFCSQFYDLEKQKISPISIFASVIHGPNKGMVVIQKLLLFVANLDLVHLQCQLNFWSGTRLEVDWCSLFCEELLLDLCLFLEC